MKNNLLDQTISRLKTIYKEKEEHNGRTGFEEVYLLWTIRQIYSYNDCLAFISVYFPTQNAGTLYKNAGVGRFLQKFGSEYHSIVAEKIDVVNVETEETRTRWRDFDVSILAQMTKLTRSQFEELHNKQIIAPEMTQKEIKEILKNI